MNEQQPQEEVRRLAELSERIEAGELPDGDISPEKLEAAVAFFRRLIGGERVALEKVTPQAAWWLIVEHEKHETSGKRCLGPLLPTYVEELEQILEPFRIAPEPEPEKRSLFEKLKRRLGRKG